MMARRMRARALRAMPTLAPVERWLGSEDGDAVSLTVEVDVEADAELDFEIDVEIMVVVGTTDVGNETVDWMLVAIAG